MHAPGVAGQSAARSHTAMAGDDDGDGIGPHRLSHRLGGHPGLAQRLRRPLRQDTVGGGLPVGNVQQEHPDQAAEGRPLRTQGQLRRLRGLSREIAVQPRRCPAQDRMVLLPGRLSEGHLPRQGQMHQGRVIAYQLDPPQGRTIRAFVKHPIPPTGPLRRSFSILFLILPHSVGKGNCFPSLYGKIGSEYGQNAHLLREAPSVIL